MVISSCTSGHDSQKLDGAFKGNHCQEVKGCAEAVDLMRLSVAIETFLVFLSRGRADDRGIERRFVRHCLQLVTGRCVYVRVREKERDRIGREREREREIAISIAIDPGFVSNTRMYGGAQRVLGGYPPNSRNKARQDFIKSVSYLAKDPSLFGKKKNVSIIHYIHFESVVVILNHMSCL